MIGVAANVTQFTPPRVGQTDRQTDRRTDRPKSSTLYPSASRGIIYGTKLVVGLIQAGTAKNNSPVDSSTAERTQIDTLEALMSTYPQHALSLWRSLSSMLILKVCFLKIDLISIALLGVNQIFILRKIVSIIMLMTFSQILVEMNSAVSKILQNV